MRLLARARGSVLASAACALLSIGWAFAAGPGVFNVRAFGAAGDGMHLDTAAISAAIKAANAAGGGVVVFPPGKYLSGTFELLSNVSLNLQAGAVIQGSGNLADYASISDYGFARAYGINSTGEGDKLGLIVARGAANVAIVGQGAIDGVSSEFFDFSTPHLGHDFDAQYARDPKAFMDVVRSTEDGPVEIKPTGRPGTLIVLTNCENILVRDVTLRNAPNWTLHLQHSRHAVVTGIRIANDLRVPNNDGIDCMDCRDLHVSDCTIEAGDDDFAIVGSQDVTVTNCSLKSHSSGVRLEDTRFATFSNLTIHANRGIGVYERGGGVTSDILFSDLVIETRLLAGHWWGKGEPIYIAAGGPGGAAQGVRNVRFSNILADAEGGILIHGTKNSLVRDIGFERVHLRIHAPRESVARGAGGNFDLRWTATSFSNAVFAHEIPAVYCRYLEGWKVRGLDIDWDAGLPAYFTSAIHCEDFARLDLEDFSGRQAAPDAPVILLRRGAGVTIRNSLARTGAGVFVALDQVSGQGLFVNNDASEAKKTFDPDPSGFALGNNKMGGEIQVRR